MSAPVEMTGRPCLVCGERCRTEGQLCPDCAAKGHRVTDDAVFVALMFDSPSLTPHDHREYVPGCFRCDLSRVEARP